MTPFDVGLIISIEENIGTRRTEQTSGTKASQTCRPQILIFFFYYYYSVL